MNYAIAKIIQINEFSIVFDKKIALQLKNGMIARDLTGENFKPKMTLTGYSNRNFVIIS